MSGKRKETRRMGLLRKTFYEEGREASRSPNKEKRASSYCWLDNTPINYDVAPSSTPDSHNLDHYFSVDEHPELQEDPSNFRHAHFLCNIKRGKKTVDGGGLGEPVDPWW
jgi:hypothetical protein